MTDAERREIPTPDEIDILTRLAGQPLMEPIAELTFQDNETIYIETVVDGIPTRTYHGQRTANNVHQHGWIGYHDNRRDAEGRLIRIYRLTESGRAALAEARARSSA